MEREHGMDIREMKKKLRKEAIAQALSLPEACRKEADARYSALWVLNTKSIQGRSCSAFWMTGKGWPFRSVRGKERWKQSGFILWMR